MNLDKYQKLTGITVPESQVATVTAQIARSRSILETMLGYTLSRQEASQNQYFERGISNDLCPFFMQNNNENDDLADPDEVVGSYRLFTYNKHDQYLAIDPFTAVHAVKLVFVGKGSADDNPRGVTHKVFRDGRLNVVTRNNVSKYIEKCQECWCVCECNYGCVQLAIDADWFSEDCLPNDLLYVWADMVKYYTDCSFNIKLEVLGPHKVEKFVNEKPEELPASLAIIKKYAGPNGTANPVITDTSENSGNPPGLRW